MKSNIEQSYQGNASKKFIDFIITRKCTYKCVYCSQNKEFEDEKKSAAKSTIDAFLNFLDKIDNSYIITITGGEAILHPDFYYLINEIKKKDFKINLITNLSFPTDVYRGIFNILKENLNGFDISAHLDEISDFNKFLKKFDEFIKFKPLNCETNLFIPIFKLDKVKKDKIKKLSLLAKTNSINVKYQHIRFLDNYTPLDEAEKKFFENEKIIESYGRYCKSGCDSCVIYEDGNAYRCYSSRFRKSNYLGNINKYDFKLRKQKCVCSSKNCLCGKPLKYGQLENEKSTAKAALSTIYDVINMPFLIWKNRKITKAKIKQYF